MPRAVAAALAVALIAAQIAVGWPFGGHSPRAEASPSISQIYFTPYEAQQYIDILRVIAGDPGCCSGPLLSTISITSGAAGNTVVYDHFEDGYEVDPYSPVQASTLTLAMDDGDVWTQTSSIPVDQPGRGAGNFYDGRDRIVSSAPVAVTQTAYASTPGSLHAGAVEVLDLDKSGTSFDIPVGEDADYNSVFEYVGLMVVGNQRSTTVQIDTDANGSFETVVALDEGETHLVNGGVNLGARIIADHPVAVYVLTGDVGARYEGRDFELYPTAVWSSELVTPVGARSTSASDGTRVFLFNPGSSAVVVDVTTSAGAAGTVNLAARGQGTFLVPVDEGARFVARGGAPIYGFQAITTEVGTTDSTSAYDWGFSLIPVNAATTSVIVPYAPGSAGLTNNYSPVWVTTFAGTTLYVDRDGDRSTGANIDPFGDRYDFTCAVTGLRSYTIYDDGTTNCYRPSQDSAAGGDRDMTGARIYTVDQTRLVSAWGQRSSYTAGAPALDVGTTILPFPSISMAKSSSVVVDGDGDGRADPGDTVAYTITMTNLGIIEVGAVLVMDEAPDYSAYVAGTTTLDGVPQADNGAPYSPSPLDADSPSGGLAVGTIPAGATRTVVFRVLVDDPLPFGVASLLNLATMTTSLGNASAANLLPLDAGLQVDKSADPGPVDPGDTIDYTIRVFNGSPIQQTGVSLSDLLPAGVTFVPGSASGDLSGSPVVVGVPPNLVPSLAMPRGSVLTVTFSVTVNDPLPPGTLQLVNTASVSSNETPGPLVATAATAVAQAPAPVVGKTPVPAALPEPGGTVTFTVTVGNTSAVAVTLTGLTDDVFGDLRDPANPLVTGNTCPAQPAAIPAGGTFSCSFDAFLAGDAGDPAHSDTVTAVVEDPGGRPGTGTATASVPFTDAIPSIVVAKTPSVGSIPEPGGTVTFAVTVSNTAVEPLTLSSLTDSVFGDLRDPANPLVANNTCPAQPAAIPVGATLACSFDAFVAGDAGDPDHADTVSALAADGEGNTAMGSDDAVVAFTDVAPSVSVAKTPSVGSVPEPGGTVTFSVAVLNTSVEAVTLASLTDSVFGNLRDPANPAVTNNTCPAQPAAIPLGGTFSCSFDAYLAGDAGDPAHLDLVTALVADDEGNPASGTDDAAVSFGDTAPAIDVAKGALPGSVAEPGGTVTFTVEVANLSVEPVTLTALADDVFGDLLDPANPLLADNTCLSRPLAIPTGGAFSCSFDAYVAGGFGDPDHVDTVTATVVDDEGTPAVGADDAGVAFTDVPPAISVTKTPSAGSIPEPGGTVTFTVEVANLSVEGVLVTDLVDDVFGDLLDDENPSVSSNTCPFENPYLPVGATFSCSFDAYLAGDAEGPDHTDTVTGVAVDDDGNLALNQAGAAVVFTDVLPAIAVDKAAGTAAVPEPGATVTFAVEVHSLAVEPVTLLSLSDDVFGNLLDPSNPLITASNCAAQPRVIPAGGIFSCTFTADLAGDPGGPGHRDVVTAVVVDDEGNPATGADDATVAFTDVPPSLSVAKTPSVGSVPEPGAAVTFAVTVQNTSVEAVTLLSLVDDRFGDLRFAGNAAVFDNTCPAQPAQIPPGGALSCSFAAFVSGEPGEAPHRNTVVAAARDDEGGTATASDDAEVAFGDVGPTLDVTKDAVPGSVPEPGAVVLFTVTVANTAVEEIVLLSLEDSEFGDLLDGGNPMVASNTCPAQAPAVPVGGFLTCSFEALVAGDAGGPDHVDVVTAVIRDDEGNTATGADDAAVVFTDVLPQLAAAKSPWPATVAEPGGTVTFAVEVSNLSVEPVTLTSLVDSVFGDLLDDENPAVSANTCPAQPAVLPPAGSLLCAFSALVAGDAGDPAHQDTISATAQDDEGNPASAGAAAQVAFTDVPPAVAVSKTPGAGSIPEPGGTVTFTVEVTNTSVEAVILASLVDSVFGDLMDEANPAVSANTCPALPAALPPAGSASCSFAADLAGDAGGPDHANTVTVAVADDEGNTTTDSDDAVVAFGDVGPTIDVVKQAEPGTVPEPGGWVAFLITVHNTSVEPVTLTSLVDDVFGDLLDGENPAVAANTCPEAERVVGAGGAFACSFSGYVAGEAGSPDHLDTVFAAATDDEGNETRGDDEARVSFGDVLPGVQVSKEAAPSTLAEPGGIVAFTVEVTNTSVEAVTLASLVDSVFGDLLDGGNLAVFESTCPAQPREIPEGGTRQCSFEALVEGEAGGPDHVDTVTATVTDDEGNPASAGGAASVAFLEIHATITGHLFIDLDGDGLQGPGEPHLAGVRVRLIDGAGHRLAVTSDALGDWEAGVEAGIASMRVVPSSVPDGLRLTTANAAQTLEALPGSVVATGDVGYQPADGSLGGKVFFDVDGDGSQGPGEPSFAGVAVALYRDGRLRHTAVTAADGSYLFEGLAPGDYRVVVRDGTSRFVGFRVTLDPDGTPDGETEVALEISEHRAGVDFAYRGTGTVGDVVWLDADGDGAQDPAEDRLAGVVVGLVWAGFDGGPGTGDDVVFPAQTTGADGAYLFTGVPPGMVSVAVDPNSVDGDLEPTTPVSYSRDLGPGEDYLDGDVGYREQQQLPNTGFPADVLGFLALGLTALGLVLLGAGQRGRRFARLRLERLR